MNSNWSAHWRAITLALISLAVYLTGRYLLPPVAFFSVTVLCVLFGGGLAVTLRWPRKFDPLFRWTWTVHGWSITGLMLFIAIVSLLHWWRILTLKTIGYGLLFSFASAYLLTVLSGSRIRRAMKSRYRLPLWLTVVGLLTVGTVTMAVVVSATELGSMIYLLSLAVVAIYVCVIVPLAVLQQTQRGGASTASELYPTVAVIVPAYNEEGSLEATIESILAAEYPDEKREVIVIDDGSSDRTYSVAIQYRDAGVQVYRRNNGGKHAALNFGLMCSDSEIVVTVDADSVLEQNALVRTVEVFQADPEVGAVAGDVRVANRDKTITNIQALEYTFSINVLRRAYSFVGAVPIVPGCLGAFRREALEAVGGYDPDTMTEDFDITVDILRAGWTVRQTDATVWTEAPFSFRDLYRQRRRWYSGGFQTLLKHRSVYFDDDAGYLRRLSYPLSFFGFVFQPVLSISIALTIGYEVATHGVGGLLIGATYVLCLMAALSLLAITIADEDLNLWLWNPFLLVLYRQFIDYVYLRSIVSVLHQEEHNWDRVTRLNQVQSDDVQTSD